MAIIISVILFTLFVIYNNKIIKGELLNHRCFLVSRDSEEYYEMSPLMFYVIFIIITAPVFLVPPFAIAKYAVYFLSLLYLLYSKRIEMPDSWIVRTYWLFFIWLVICAFRSPVPGESISFLIKYAIPILSLYLGYSALQSKYDIYFLIRIVLITVLIYTFLIGGLAAKFYSWFYFSPIGAQFLKYAGFADYQTSLFVLPFLMVWITGEKKWYWIAGAMILSSILEVVRTGLGGMLIVASVFYFFRYKVKSHPIIGTVIGVMIAVILFVPAVNQKFFGDKSGTVSAEEIVQGNAMSLDNIQTNGREFMWHIVMSKCYDGHEIAGSGLGSSIKHLKYVRENIIKVPLLLHNDYVQIMCDTGLIGLTLLILFFISLLLKVSALTWHTNDFVLKITGIMSIASMCGVAFSMGFDNVVSHSMTSLVMPFIFTGFFLKAIKLSENDELS